jgi:hypothetical protein
MSPLFARMFLPIALACACLGTLKAQAAPLTEDDASQIRGVIVQQFDAFVEDDADRAFQTATPQVREAIGSPARFLALVRGAYPMVYRPVQVNFREAQERDGQILQAVEIKDSEDKSWLGIFVLERQSDASFRISGCAVAETNWKDV